MMKHIFIINPTSGLRHSTKLIPMIEAYFKDQPEAFEIHLTDYPQHAKELAMAATKGPKTLYVLGGDGTANEVLNGLSAEHAMAIIPSGTGNDFYRMLEIPDLKLQELLIQTIEGKEVLVDFALADQLRFINSFSMGFDADIGILADKLKRKYPILTPVAYGLAIVFMLLNRTSRKLDLEMDGTHLQTNSLMVAVMNGKFYGGGFAPTPMASIQDGVLDVCIVENTYLLNVLRILPKYLKGTHLKEKQARFFKVKSLKIQGDTLLNAQTDGEGMRVQSLEFKIVSKGLRLRVPQISKLEG